MPTPAVRHKSSKSSDGAMPTPAVRHKDSKKDTSKAQKMESTDDSSDDSAPQPTEDASSDDSDAQPTADSTDASTDDSDAQPAADSTDASNDDPTPTEDSSNASDDGSAQPTDDGSAQAPGAGPQPSNTTQPALNYFDSLTIQLTSADDFCLLLPSSPGGKKDNNNKIDVEAISKSEGSAVAFCLKKSAEKSPKAHNMPEGLINSAYFFKNETADYSQISGTINPKAYMLSPKDYGGQVNIVICILRCRIN
jgi:hypothetical protein